MKTHGMGNQDRLIIIRERGLLRVRHCTADCGIACGMRAAQGVASALRTAGVTSVHLASGG